MATTSQPAVCTKTYKLNDGTELPAVGLGTFQGGIGTEDEAALVESVVHALKNGYRLIDTAMAYGVESAIGKAVNASGIPRSDIKVMTKFWVNFNNDPEEALRVSLATLGLDYIDIFLLHYPNSHTRDMMPLPVDSPDNFVETWKKMEKLVGPKCRTIGVCNLTQKTMDKLLESATVVPALNQVELHAFNPNFKLVPYCESKGIHVISWRTIGGMYAENDVLTHQLFTGIAKAHGCSSAVVSLSWAVQRGVSVIPKSTNKARIVENIRLVTLGETEMAQINSAYETIDKYRIADFIPQLQVEVGGKKTFLGWTKADMGWEDDNGTWLT